MYVLIGALVALAGAVSALAGVTGSRPDWVVRQADQIELVDSSPEQLRRRMLHGNIYPKERVPQALTNFFRTDNLTALRELALRFLAGETHEELIGHLQRQGARTVWGTSERILAAVRGAKGNDVLLRRAARIASRVKGDFDVINVASDDASSPGDRRSLDRLRQLATDLGADWHEVHDDDPAMAIARFARQHQITQIVIGASERSRWRQVIGGGSNVARIIKEAGAFGIDVHVIARRDAAPKELDS